MPLYENAAVEGTEDMHKPIPVSQFSEYISQMRRDKNAGFAKQHKVIFGYSCARLAIVTNWRFCQMPLTLPLKSVLTQRKLVTLVNTKI